MANSLPSKMKAIKITEQNTAEIREVPLPKLRDDYMLVKVDAVALNPTDWKHIYKIGKGGETVGVDLCGTIIEIGPKVTKPWNKGSRIATFVHGGNASQHEDGAFAEYAMVKGDLGISPSESMSSFEAATLGAGVITCGQALYQSLGLPLPNDTSNRKESFAGTFVLIYGASTATGTLAVQYAKLSGARVIATSSPQNFDLLKSLGAEQVFSYKDPECAAKIRSYTNDSLQIVLDCISEHNSPQICEESISSTKGGAISYLLRAKHTREDVENKHTLGYTVVGEAFEKMGHSFAAKPEDFEFSKKFCELTEGLLKEGKLVPHPQEKNLGGKGLEGVLQGIEELRQGRVSGKKLVYAIGE
ncbi:hypothetical protein CKM354_001201800 [Cercospora kikuchii]|uniref:Enoyl reductase (ER) domain-containing protein n=1 Tax=Cercospora kikuchii TaxID=84275 RepID=A0A9P3FLE3_9PEZI|nr:uncharacterized protein CKM354_001201800 [Cercospora kikuchii]GIZ48975.1 hypothetical protein CKM354_001201800 [Cercospora kikuchii]